MIYDVKLKTGFFEKTLYKLFISENLIVLSPVILGSNKEFSITSEHLVSIEIINIKHTEIEIKTLNESLTCILSKKTDISKLITVLKENFNKKISYKEE
ncbi:MAG: hypothetical protein VB128_03700 [Sedimentibacter saalensis]|uniref:hypothetical protein n=1 Tax=Sedimentibacter saalensis TaxID=130788 RepID=UPI002B1F676B|nr:hypothetical protein [Sedimentibacter saalensis]MEA5094041.1 hypothetical protein [Sedimentibacter saalensis]